MRRYLAFLALVCTACAGDTLTEPCRAQEGCLPGNVVIRFEVLDDVFPPRHDRAGEPVWGPGDTIAFRIAVENQAAAPAESFTFEAGFGPGGGSDGEERPIQLEPMTVPRLEPGERVLFTDTAVVALEIHEPALRLAVSGATAVVGGSPLDARIVGDTLVPVLTAGYELELVDVPEQTLIDVGGTPEPWARWRAHTEYRVVLRIRNPYETPLQPFRITWCWRDIDWCPGGYGETAPTPPVPPGESREIEIPMTVVNGNVTWFWDAVRRPMVLCTDGSPADDCVWQFNLEALPNFEAECTVPTIVPGQQVTDDTADCDSSGSAYRFTALAGERYRVEAAEGSAFIVGPDGKPENEPGQTEITIPTDGDYYVILDQREIGATTVTFTLVQL